MKNTKELLPVLTAIFCINRTSKQEDKDITSLLNYAFRRCFDSNCNLLLLSCIGHTKDSIMPQVMTILEKETKYKQITEEQKYDNR